MDWKPNSRPIAFSRLSWSWYSDLSLTSSSNGDNNVLCLTHSARIAVIMSVPTTSNRNVISSWQYHLIHFWATLSVRSTHSHEQHWIKSAELLYVKSSLYFRPLVHINKIKTIRKEKKMNTFHSRRYTRKHHWCHQEAWLVSSPKQRAPMGGS